MLEHPWIMKYSDDTDMNITKEEVKEILNNMVKFSKSNKFIKIVISTLLGMDSSRKEYKL